MRFTCSAILTRPNFPMPDISLTVLRKLRDRASTLLRTAPQDLAPFKKEDGTFRRKPDSRSPAWDTNVTTTCSCLMALALTDQFRKFYGKTSAKDSQSPEKWAETIFKTLLQSPWMSSGLADNNAFTTSLVLRAYGFLEEECVFGKDAPKPGTKDEGRSREWDLHLDIRNVPRLVRKLKKHSDAASEFIWFSLSDDCRNQIAEASSSGPTANRLRETLALDLRRIIQSGWMYDAKRFGKASKTSKEAIKKFDSAPSAYKLARLNHRILAEQFAGELSKPRIRSLREIAELIAGDSQNFSINQYPPSSAVVYWFVDGIARAGIALSGGRWDSLCKWAAQEFNHRRSLVVAEHDAMMDPVAMGMCACLCARLRAITERPRLGARKEHLTVLPSRVELERSIEELVTKQTKSGIWNKYFPLFHYQDAGSNFCFTFELLEAILYEFGKSRPELPREGSTDSRSLLANSNFLEALEKAVGWCEANRLSSTEGTTEYRGWNSGGQIETLEKGQPESWATAVVHMFLSELTTVLSERIQEQILTKYKARAPRIPHTKETNQPGPSALGSLLDIDVMLRGTVQRLSSVLQSRIIEPYRVETAATLRRRSIEKPRSALLFGPPGTSKTEITKAIADDLGWPLVEITPSDFVKGTLANVYLQADEIFDDLMDLSGVVVFFDEMDALVQTREGETQLDIASQFLTTSMLPKLTHLHERGRVVFLMATNFQDRFDAAIKRAGRFDLLLCMGPPTVKEKLERLHGAFKLDKETEQTKKAAGLIAEYLKNHQKLRDQFALLTFGEYKSFLKTIGEPKKIGDAVAGCGAAEFRSRLETYARYVTLKLDDIEPLRDGLDWKDWDELRAKFNLTLKDITDRKVPITHIVRYLVDWRESKEQS
jgi:hypothetical protein